MSKLSSLRDAIERWVPDGSSVVMSAALESLITFAAGHEIIRQGKRDLTLIAPISDMLFDQIIGAGCVAAVQAAWIGNVSAGLGHNYRRAAEEGVPRDLRIEDHSNFSISLALLAGGMGVPYLPTRTLLGTDILRRNGSFKVEQSPFGGEPLALVPALVPDVAILQVQRADVEGHAHVWGNLGVSREAMLAARHTILVAEEVVPREVIASDPNRVLGPAGKVAAVVQEPGGAHPAPVQGFHNRDHEFFHEYHRATRTAEGWRAWLKEWVLEVPDRATYLEKLGADRWGALQRREHRFAAPVDYGY
ncbi:MAG: CoA transferase subunit A [Chloroflexi bacterium]|nr:CoA transferase subunit A [Chloroflexota bacterium]